MTRIPFRRDPGLLLILLLAFALVRTISRIRQVPLLSRDREGAVSGGFRAVRMVGLDGEL
jgi:hypothetical protein